MTDKPQPTKRYRVKLGHSEVSVECNSKEAAIRLARISLSDDMPRLYDVIHSAEDKQFLVNLDQPMEQPDRRDPNQAVQ